MNAFSVLGAVAGRPDCPPDIAAAILWSIQNLGQPVEEIALEPVVTTLKEPGLTYPGRKHSISYSKALKVFKDWKKHGNISQSAKRHGVTYSQAWNVCKGKTYPEISGRESVTVHTQEPGARRNLTPDEVRNILVMSQTKQPSVIADELGLKFATVHAIVMRRTVIAGQIAKELGMDAPAERYPRGRGPNVTNEEKAAIKQMLDEDEDLPASVIASKIGISIRTAQHLKLQNHGPNSGKFGRAQIKGMN